MTGTLIRLLDPKSIAIAGVSADSGKHGSRVVANLRRHGYRGTVWGVNPRVPDLDDIEVYPTVTDLPARPDLVVAAVPADATFQVVAESSGVGMVIAFASGFGETGPAGAEMEKELASAASSVGTRLLGPNSGGVIRPGRGLAASFLTCLDRPSEEVRSGPVAVVTQSGGTGSYLHNLAAARGEGLAVSVSTGNEVDIKLGETIDAVSRLDEVRVVLAIVETVRDGVAFIDAIRSAHSRDKRVVVCRIGSGTDSKRLMTSHTGALAVPDAILEGVLRSLGVPVAETPAEAYDVAAVLAKTPAQTGPRAGIVTHSGGIAILLSDLAERAGLDLRDPGPALSTAVAGALNHGTAGNPLDMGGIIGGPHRFAEVVGQFAGSGEYDVVLAVTTAHPPVHTDERVSTLLSLEVDVPVIHLWMAGDQGDAGLARLREAGAPITDEPRAAIRALAALTDGSGEEMGPDPIEGPPEDWGIPRHDGMLATSPAEAVAAANSLGYPVAVKMEAPDVAHKTELGGILLDLRTADEVESAHQTVVERAAKAGRLEASSRVQRYQPGLELIVGGMRHESFGPLVSVGMGGVFTEVVADVVFSTAPITAVAALRMIDHLRTRSLLDGFRGAPAADVDELASIVSLVSRGIAGSHLTEFEINPLVWTGSQWVVLDWFSRTGPPS